MRLRLCGRRDVTGVPWPALWSLVDHWLWTGGTELYELDDALATWRLRNPTRHQGART